jgi:hypothetical protein
MSTVNERGVDHLAVPKESDENKRRDEQGRLGPVAVRVSRM